MELCSDSHDEVCFDSKHCPVCWIRDDLEDQIDELNNTISDLNDEINELEGDNNG
jgi:TolA-binding protein